MELFLIIYIMIVFSLPLVLIFAAASLLFAAYDFATTKPRPDLFRD